MATAKRGARKMFDREITMDEALALTTDDVMSVYSGKNGACCCGCAGEHTYNPKHRAVGTASRGYAVGAEECDEQRVGRILRKVQRAVSADPLNAMFGSNNVAVVVGKRIYIVYPLEPAKEVK